MLDADSGMVLALTRCELFSSALILSHFLQTVLAAFTNGFFTANKKLSRFLSVRELLQLMSRIMIYILSAWSNLFMPNTHTYSSFCLSAVVACWYAKLYLTPALPAQSRNNTSGVWGGNKTSGGCNSITGERLGFEWDGWLKRWLNYEIELVANRIP